MADPVQKVKKAARPKKPSTHPKYSEMVRAAITSLKERGGSSRQAVLRYILSHYNVGKDEKAVNTHLKLALKSGVKKGVFKQAKGTGAAGSFRLGAVAEKKPQKAKSARSVRKPKASKQKTKPVKSPAKKSKKAPAKKAEKKTTAKKTKKPPAKKPVAKKAKKSPAKKKPAAKKAARKPATKKAAAKK